MEWRFVLSHLSCHTVPPSQLNEDKTTNSAECFCHKELDFGIEVIGLHQPKRESISMVACVEEDSVQTRPGRHVQNPIRVDVESDFNLRQAT